MLREIRTVRQYPGEPRRRWFAAETMDLFVWYDDTDRITGFQLSYDKPHAERAITWRRTSGFSHTRVDDGANPGRHPATPLLVADGEFEPSRVMADFRLQAAGIDGSVVQFVIARLKEYRPASLEATADTPAHAHTGWQGLLARLQAVLARWRP